MRLLPARSPADLRAPPSPIKMGTMDATSAPRADYDTQRGRCPVNHGEDGVWTLDRHADVEAAALDDRTFSSATSHHLHVPNAMDDAEHAKHWALIDRYLFPERVAELAPAIAKASGDGMSACGLC